MCKYIKRLVVNLFQNSVPTRMFTIYKPHKMLSVVEISQKAKLPGACCPFTYCFCFCLFSLALSQEERNSNLLSEFSSSELKSVHGLGNNVDEQDRDGNNGGLTSTF